MSNTGEPTTYFELQQERDQELEADALADGHSALMLERAKGTVPTYPAQPSSSPWSSDPVPTEPPTGELIDAVKDVSKVGG
jgi:hypothetical protein